MPPLLSLPVGPSWLLLFGAVLWRALTNRAAGRVWYHLPPWEDVFGLAGILLLVQGSWLGLIDAPAERMMGEVGRILYVHVPSAWATLVSFGFAAAFAVAHLLTGRARFDDQVEACVEVGVVMGGVLLVTGSAFARPTWGTWWTWDPRLTSTAVMEIAFVGVLLLRQAVQDPERRATWSSIASILAATSMIVTYVSVKLWRSIHQSFSSPDTIDGFMTLIMRMNAFGFLCLATWRIARRTRIAAARAAAEAAPALPSRREVGA